jgi:N-methylhydantoinase A
VVVPPVAALYSAFGMFAMDIGQDHARTFVGRVKGIDLDALNRVYREMEEQAAASFRGHGIDPKAIVLKRTADMRYVGQFTEVEADMPNGILGREAIDVAAEFFARKHEELYTFAMPWKPVEILTLRLKATTPNPAFALPQVQQGGADPKSALKRRRTCRFKGRDVDTPVYDGEKVLAGHVISGPAIIEETTTTVVIPEAYTCSVDKYKNYVLTRG